MKADALLWLRRWPHHLLLCTLRGNRFPWLNSVSEHHFWYVKENNIQVNSRLLDAL